MYLFWCEITAPPVLIMSNAHFKENTLRVYSLLLETGGEGCVSEGTGEISESHTIITQPTLLRLQLLQSWIQEPIGVSAVIEL